ncbi:zinc-dependent alcohol dehydrogenase [Allostreptomyces psammosilenae]|uniref:2-deoxy-scyllo-inosamine dehydrogenase n=1 Tax=Allostreptomyces psammosilenae TaxID=1892865 RepID=A0A852ZLN1_9ACTN|nr:alcohol dehydrogenase catalytic domain-containing protein [Allostreptomyces psammosilenae]NYI03303.1 2-desacetyl-2-hydroxyethyl bacteriochlorophyllide A dehydrogenase [Allostreptomyces psammosilenae]
MTSTDSRSVLLEAPGRHRLVEGPVREPGPGEVRVRVGAAGLCGSDRELYTGTRPAQYCVYPIVPGHEWSGTVEAVGPGVPERLVGCKAVAEGFRSCGLCDRCRFGDTSLCEAGYEETGFTLPGAFADHVVLPARLLHPLSDDADLRAAALLEPAAVMAATQLRCPGLPGERVAVVGGGTLGMLGAQLYAACHPAELTVVTRNTARAERAMAFGATRLISPEEAAREAGRYDLVVETAGARSTAADSVRLARRGGRVVLTGIPAPGAVDLDPIDLVVRQIQLHTVFGAPSDAWAHAVRAFNAGLLTPAPLITAEFGLEDYAKAVEEAGRAAGKVLLVP